MIIFTDAITGDELCSDAFNVSFFFFLSLLLLLLPYPELINPNLYQMVPVGALTEVNCENVTIKEGEVDIGANASAEEQSEALEDGAKTVSDRRS